MYACTPTPPTRAQIREIVDDLDEGLRLELDALIGRGLWTPAGHTENLAWRVDNGPLAHTLVDARGRPVIAFGLDLIRLGVVQTWFIARHGWQAMNYELALAHADLAGRLFLPGTGVHRAQAISLAGRDKVRPWFERLGYTHESVQTRAGAQGEDLDVYHYFPRGA